jgi:hypothetical protein
MGVYFEVAGEGSAVGALELAQGATIPAFFVRPDEATNREQPPGVERVFPSGSAVERTMGHAVFRYDDWLHTLAD